MGSRLRSPTSPPCLQVAHEAGLPLEAVLDAVRGAAPAWPPAASPASAAGSPPKSPRPKSPTCTAQAGKPSADPAALGVLSVPASAPSPPLSSKLQQQVVTLQQLLEEGLGGEEEGAILAHPGQPPAVAPVEGPAVQRAQQGSANHLLLNPAFQVGDPACFLL